MSQVEDAWNDVGDQFKKLGAMLKEHYDEQGVDEAREDSDERVEEAVRSLGDGIKAAVGAVGDSISDPEVKGEMRDTAGSLFAALGTTFSEIGTQISNRRERTDEGAVEPAVDESRPDEEE